MQSQEIAKYKDDRKHSSPADSRWGREDDLLPDVDAALAVLDTGAQDDGLVSGLLNVGCLCNTNIFGLQYCKFVRILSRPIYIVCTIRNIIMARFYL
jgi:hypothetical protein